MITRTPNASKRKDYIIQEAILSKYEYCSSYVVHQGILANYVLF